MLKQDQVIEIHARLFGGAHVLDRWKTAAGEIVLDSYECADADELLSVLDALGCDFEATSGK